MVEELLAGSTNKKSEKSIRIYNLFFEAIQPERRLLLPLISLLSFFSPWPINLRR